MIVLAVAWVRSGAAARFQSASWTWLKLFPWMRSILASYEGANFCELLALLLEHQVTYPLASKLAAESTGNPRMVRGARALADAISGGEAVPRGLDAIDRKAFLPMLRLGSGDGPRARVALEGASEPRRALPQTRQVPRREAIRISSNRDHGGPGCECHLVLCAGAFLSDHQLAQSACPGLKRNEADEFVPRGGHVHV